MAQVVVSISGVSYYWNEAAKNQGILDEKLQVGVLAQEVQKVLPEAVHEHDGRLHVVYDKLIAVLIEAIKELDAKIENKGCNCSCK